MIVDWLCCVGEWLFANFMVVMMVGFIFLAAALVCQIVINKMSDDALEDCQERVKELEKELGDCRKTLEKIGAEVSVKEG